jgi:hypothetical protein
MPGLLVPLECMGFDMAFEGRMKLDSQYYFSSPRFHKDFDNAFELRLGVLGNAWENDHLRLDYEMSGNAIEVDGPSEQSGLRRETDVDFFRAWLRLEAGNFQIRGGRQKILFGAGNIFRPLGFFDTRDITGVVPQTRGTDSIRTTYFFDSTSFVQTWLVPAKLEDRMIVGARLEGPLAGMDAGAVIQYHPETDLTGLPSFASELFQSGFHLKGEYEIGYWTEGRVDLQLGREEQALRLDWTAGIDYTFNVGEGLHVLLEYFLSDRGRNFIVPELGNTLTVQQLGVLFDQPIGIDIKWQVFSIYDLGDHTFQVVPQIEYAVMQDLYLYIHGRWGGRASSGSKNGRLFQDSPVFSGKESTFGLSLVSYF